MIDWYADQSDKLVGTTAALIALAAAGASATGTIVASKMNANAADKAATIQGASTDKATALAQSQADESRREFDAQQAAAKAQWDTEQSNKAPYRQVSADALLRVRDLLGLPQGSPLPSSTTAPTSSTTMPGASSSLTPGSGNPTDLNAITAALTDNYKKLGTAPTGRGTGPTDIAYFADQIQKTGGLTPGNTGYWFGPSGRIAQELAKAGGGGGAAPKQQTAVMPTSSLMPSTMGGPATSPNYTPIVPFSSLLSGVR